MPATWKLVAVRCHAERAKNIPSRRICSQLPTTGFPLLLVTVLLSVMVSECGVRAAHKRVDAALKKHVQQLAQRQINVPLQPVSVKRFGSSSSSSSSSTGKNDVHDGTNNGSPIAGHDTLTESWTTPVRFFDPDFACTENVMKYTIHGGWGNQVAGLRRALLLANILNRTLVVPPVMSHSQLAYGKCRRHMRSNAETMRNKAAKLYPKLSGKSGSSAIDLFDKSVLQKAVKTVGWAQWHRQCEPLVEAAQYQNVQHDCGLVIESNNTWKWQLPPDMHKGKEFTNGAWIAEDLTSLPAGYETFKERASELRKSTKRVLHFGTLFPHSVYSDQFLGFSAQVMAGYLVYHPELWEIPCQVAREASPYATIHVRGGDGIFRKRHHFLKAVDSQTAEVASQLKTPEIQNLLHALKNATSRDDCAGGDAKKYVRVMLITDLKWGALVTKMETNFQTFGSQIVNITREIGWGVKTSTTRTAAGSAAVHALSNAPRLQQAPGSFAPLLLDIMVAVLSDVAFAGSPDSTLSRHVDQMRQFWGKDTVCAAHDAKAKENFGSHRCPGHAESEFDVKLR